MLGIFVFPDIQRGTICGQQKGGVRPPDPTLSSTMIVCLPRPHVGHCLRNRLAARKGHDQLAAVPPERLGSSYSIRATSVFVALVQQVRCHLNRYPLSGTGYATNVQRRQPLGKNIDHLARKLSIRTLLPQRMNAMTVGSVVCDSRGRTRPSGPSPRARRRSPPESNTIPRGVRSPGPHLIASRMISVSYPLTRQ
jgi:hypothetical protein